MADTDAGAWSIIDNEPNYNAVQGAGIQTAETAARAGAEAVLTGHCGPKAFRTLAAAGIPVVVGVSGSVGDAVRAYQSGELKATDAPDVQGHWS
jgi:predicted Fe-Mo cluster-binding NifX family protein